jgi:3-oxoacyl-(acyl-carrier-protein) synthase
VLSGQGVSRPFDRRRDGFVLGEGAAMVVLAAARGEASVELLGIGRTLDARSLTAPDPDGDGAARAIAAALADAGMAAVDYVQAHGPSTLLGDPAEIAALGRVLGPASAGVYVSSVKGALGHWIAGAGALGFLCAAHAVATGAMLPTANLGEPDAACALPVAHIRGAAIRKDVRSALANAFAFGGANSCLVVGRAT